MNDAGIISIVAFISPYFRDRKNAREIIGTEFIEIFLNTLLEECESRDPSNLAFLRYVATVGQGV